MPSILFEALESLAREHPDRPAIWAGDPASYSQVLTDSEAWLRRLQRFAGLRIGIALCPSAAWLALVAACDRLAISVVLLNPQSDAHTRFAIAGSMGLAAILPSDAAGIDGFRAVGSPVPARAPTTVTIMTSGTSGEPKRIVHTWESLLRPVRVQPQFAQSRWLLAYPLHVYAGLQVFLQCFWNAGTLYLLPSGRDPVEISALIADERIEYLSATPSFLRRLAVFGARRNLKRACLKNVTLGGEVISDDILQRLREAFPQARITHLYASSELGRCFSVTDGRAGFPARYLTHVPDAGVEVRIVNGELQVRSPNCMLESDRGSTLPERSWISTDDLVHVVGDRVLFCGRRTDIVNVAGHKVHPAEVEAVLREIPGVAEAQVHRVPSSLAGSLLAARVVAAPGVDAAELKKALTEHCLRRLRPFQRPRLVDLVSRLDLSQSHKLQRGEISA